MPAQINQKPTNKQTRTLPLKPAEVARFNEEGFLVKDFGFDDEMIDAVKADVYPFYSEGFRANPVTPERFRNGWKHLDSVKQLAIAPQVLEALEQLWGRKALAFQTLNFPIGTSQKAHSDTIHFNTEPPGFMAGVWIALEDIDKNNGPLVYYPGSHKMDALTMSDLKLQPGREHYPEYENAIQRVINENGLKPALGNIKKGEAIIWHANLLHGGHPHQDSSRSRHSQVTHYFFEDCRYYTPMLYGENDQRSYDHPEWINQSPLSLMQRIKNKLIRTLNPNA